MKQKFKSSLVSAAANMFDLYKKSHIYHINVTGTTFSQDHAFLGELYAQFSANFDAIAELIRIEGDLLPSDFESSSIISRSDQKNRDSMFSDILQSIGIAIASLENAHAEAIKENSIGTFTTLETIIEGMVKSRWMVQSSL